MPLAPDPRPGTSLPRWLGWVWAGARADDTATQRRKLMQSNLAAGLMIAIILVFNGLYLATGNAVLIASGAWQLPFVVVGPVVWQLSAAGRPDLARWAMFLMAMGGCGAVIVAGQGTRLHAHSYFLLYAVMAAGFFPVREWRSSLTLIVLNLLIFARLQVWGWPHDPGLEQVPANVLGLLQVGIESCCLVVVVAVVLLSETVAEHNEQQLRHLALTDLLTDLPNRRAFSRALTDEVARSQRHGRPLTLAVLDLDLFKRINDTQGHAAGDEALRRVAGVLRAQARQVDLVARIGGEEFALLMPDTSALQAWPVAERVRQALAAQPSQAVTGPVTTSIGLAALKPGMDADLLLRAGDQALYEAKRLGRNRVVVAQA